MIKSLLMADAGDNGIFLQPACWSRRSSMTALSPSSHRSSMAPYARGRVRARRALNFRTFGR
jgi:hypothetical protein